MQLTTFISIISMCCKNLHTLPWVHTAAKKIFSLLAPRSENRRALKDFAKPYIRPNFQSCPIELKLKLHSLLTLLIPKILSLSILNHKYGIFFSKSAYLKSAHVAYQARQTSTFMVQN